MEHTNKPHQTDWKRFLLLPILALGAGTIIAGWKKPPAATRPSPQEIAEIAKREAYRDARYLIVSEGLWKRGRPEADHLTGLAPYSDWSVTRLGPGRFRCSGSLTAASAPAQRCESAGSASWSGVMRAGRLRAFSSRASSAARFPCILSHIDQAISR